MGSWKPCTQICGQQSAETERASKGKSVSSLSHCSTNEGKNIERLPLFLSYLLFLICYYSAFNMQNKSSHALSLHYEWNVLCNKNIFFLFCCKIHFKATILLICWNQNICLFSRDHYVEGRMRGVAPNKKIAAVQQKNVDVWVWVFFLFFMVS